MAQQNDSSQSSAYPEKNAVPIPKKGKSVKGATKFASLTIAKVPIAKTLMPRIELKLFELGRTLGARFVLKKKLAQGDYGAVYEAHDSAVNKALALKCQRMTGNEPDDVEKTVLKAMQSSVHCPKFVANGVDEEKHLTYVVVQLLDRNFTKVRNSCKLDPCRLSLKACFHMAVQCTEALEQLHTIGYVHRDVRPSNIMVGFGECSKIIYLIDYGMCRYFMDTRGGVKAPRLNAGFRGSVRYASPAAHENCELSRKDDFWSLFYSLRESITGRLPWRRSNDKAVVGRMKVRYSMKILCDGLPAEVLEFAKHIEHLKYADKPNYRKLSESMKRAMSTHCANDPDNFDWEVPECGIFGHWVRPEKPQADVTE